MTAGLPSCSSKSASAKRTCSRSQPGDDADAGAVEVLGQLGLQVDRVALVDDADGRPSPSRTRASCSASDGRAPAA